MKQRNQSMDLRNPGLLDLTNRLTSECVSYDTDDSVTISIQY